MIENRKHWNLTCVYGVMLALVRVTSRLRRLTHGHEIQYSSAHLAFEKAMHGSSSDSRVRIRRMAISGQRLKKDKCSENEVQKRTESLGIR